METAVAAIDPQAITPSGLTHERRHTTPADGDQDLCRGRARGAVRGVNRHDCNQRQRGPSPAHSDVPGLEVAGLVVAVGHGVAPEWVGQRVCALTDGGGYAQFATAPATHVLPMSGGKYSAANVKALARRGRIVHLSPGEDAALQVPLRALMAKEAVVTGSLLRPLPDPEKTAIAERLRVVVWHLITGRRVRPVVHQCFALRQAQQAHRAMEAGAHMGKIALTITSSFT